MKLSRPLLALLTTGLLLAAGSGRAQPLLMPSLVLVDDFESYANSNALAAVWPKFAGSGVLGLETNIICGGSQSLRLAYSLSASPNTNTLARNFGSPQDWSGFNTITFNYGGKAGNSTDNVIVQLLDHLGGVLGSFIITGATAFSPCTNIALDLSKYSAFTNTTHHTDLRDVQSLVLGVSGGTSRGSGTVYFDNLVVGNNGNLIANPGFQDLNNDGVFGDGWNSFGVQQFLNVLPERTPGHATFYSDTTGNTGGVYWAGSPTVVGTKYRLTVDADCESLWHADTQFGVEFLDTDFTTVLTQRIVSMFLYTNSPFTYKTYSMSAVVPPGVAAVRPVIRYSNSVHQSTSNQRGVLDNALLAVETNRVLSIFAASIHKGLYASGQTINYTLGGSYAHSFGALLTSNMTPNGWRVDNRSVPGDSITNLQSRFYLDELPVGADVVFIGTSMGNSELHGSPIPNVIFDQFFVGYSNLVAMSRSNGLLPMLGCGFPRNMYTSNEFTWIKKMDLLINTFDVPSANFVGATDDGVGHIVSGYGDGDGIHFNDLGHYELFMCFVPSVFDALMAGKPTPRWSDNHSFARILANERQPAPLSFTPSSTVHSFSASFRVRAGGAGTIASVTLPGAASHPTVEVKPAGVMYVGSGGQVVSSPVSIMDGAWHEVLIAHQYSRTQTWFYLDSVLVGSVAEQLKPVGFVLGGHGSAVARPGSPPSADYENWFIHRSALNSEEVKAHFGGALQQSSLEIYAPLDDSAFLPGSTVTNRAQSLAMVAVNGANIYPQPVIPITYAPGRVLLNLYSVPNSNYVVQRSASADFSAYTALFSNTAPANGLISFTDTNLPTPSAFYRLQQR